MTKNDIVLDIANKTDMRQTEVKQIVQMTLDGVINTLATNGRLELRNFGVFEVRDRRPRKARNPRTGEEVMVPACKTVTFKPGKRMEECIADGKTVGEEPQPSIPAPQQPAAPPVGP